MKIKESIYGIIAEASFYGFIYYALYLLKIEGNLSLNALILFILMNISIMFCPVVRKCYKG